MDWIDELQLKDSNYLIDLLRAHFEDAARRIDNLSASVKACESVVVKDPRRPTGNKAFLVEIFNSRSSSTHIKVFSPSHGDWVTVSDERGRDQRFVQAYWTPRTNRDDIRPEVMWTYRTNAETASSGVKLPIDKLCERILGPFVRG